MNFLYISAAQVLIEIIIFLILMLIFRFIYKKFRNNSNKFLNPYEYFPEDEVHSLKQMFYLIMMGLLFIVVLYSLTFTQSDVIYFVIYDIALSLYLTTKIDNSSPKNIILLLLIIPYGALTYVLYGESLIGLLDLIHIPVFIYFMKLYYDKYHEYTESNGLGMTIILLFTIIFLSFLWTQLVEGVNALDSLVMVSNAFTSNGYAILGHTIPGKLNSLLLVWSGYILSGVGTATLTAAILMRHFNSKFEELEKMIEKNNKD